MRKLLVENHGPLGEPIIPHNYPVRLINREELTQEEKLSSYMFDGTEYSKFELITPNELKERYSDSRLNDCVFFACSVVGTNEDGKPPEFVDQSKPIGAHTTKPELTQQLIAEGWEVILSKGELQANQTQYRGSFDESAGQKKINANKKKPEAIKLVDQWEVMKISLGHTIDGFTYPISQTALNYFTTLFSIRNSLAAQFFPVQLPSLDGASVKSVANVQALEGIYNQLAVAALTLKSQASAKKMAIINASTREEIEAVLLTLE